MNINFDDDICKIYAEELRSIKSKEQLEQFLEKWEEIFRKKKKIDIDYDTFKLLLEAVNKEVITPRVVLYLELLAPYRLVKIDILAKKFRVPSGTIYRQLYGKEE